MTTSVIQNQENKVIRFIGAVLYTTVSFLWNQFFMVVCLYSLYSGWYVSAIWFLIFAFYTKLSDICDLLRDLKKQKENKNVR